MRELTLDIFLFQVFTTYTLLELSPSWALMRLAISARSSELFPAVAGSDAELVTLTSLTETSSIVETLRTSTQAANLGHAEPRGPEQRKPKRWLLES
ncbi:hypothetical protein F5B22DRAFT_607322 [Xylaria bambusicola]|uniref:uncharacterized protein n=1 Tax=Xylaria bambusicola TaxID=326684 RepID=UPI0020081D0D|nr:uncharacterized protein F5B22DRAFT_607322 [Xylaria bambusicola]KAI0515422.1 hypothetical protein F5B22DRAFT_607322 [Xylaria bambusicola]